MINQPPPSEGVEHTELLKPGQVGPAHLLYQTGVSPDAPLPRLPQVRASATELSTQAQRAGRMLRKTRWNSCQPPLGHCWHGALAIAISSTGLLIMLWVPIVPKGGY